MSNPEATLKQTIARRLKLLAHPPLVISMSNRFSQGWPDVLYLSHTGQSLWVEYKIHPNKLSAIQTKRITQLLNHRQNVAVITKHSKHFVVYHNHLHITLTDILPWLVTQLST